MEPPKIPLNISDLDDYKVVSSESGANLTLDDIGEYKVVSPEPVTDLTLDNIGEYKVVSSPDSVQPLTEDTIRQDKRWIDAAYKVYEMNEGPDAVKLNSDKQAAEYALDYMGWFNYNLPKMGLEAAQLGSATDEQKKSFVTLMDMYDQKRS